MARLGQGPRGPHDRRLLEWHRPGRLLRGHGELHSRHGAGRTPMHAARDHVPHGGVVMPRHSSELQKAVTRKLFTKHGQTIGKGTPTYRSWKTMIQRCTNPNTPRYAYYGGRGITVFAPWRSFQKFYADMGPRPDGTTLDRWPDNNGNYEPWNCRWATPKQQQANRRTSR